MSSSVQRLDGVAVGVEARVATGVGVGVGGAAAYVLGIILGIKMEYRTKAIAHITPAIRIRILIMISPVLSSTRTRSIEPLAPRTFRRAAIRSPLSLEGKFQVNGFAHSVLSGSYCQFTDRLDRKTEIL